MSTPDALRPGAESIEDDADLPVGPPAASTETVDAPENGAATAATVADEPTEDGTATDGTAADDCAVEDAVVPGARRRNLRPLVRGGRRWLLRVLALLSLAAFAALAVGPHLFGYRTVTMRSGSMRPFANAGDMLIVRPESLTAVRPGQVLTFEAPMAGNPVLSHRVVTVEQRAGSVRIRTKGDANSEPDHWVAQLGGTTAWRTVVVVPHLGRLVAALHRPAVHAVSSWLLPVWLLAEVLRVLWRRPRVQQPDDVVDGKAEELEVTAQEAAT